VTEWHQRFPSGTTRARICMCVENRAFKSKDKTLVPNGAIQKINHLFYVTYPTHTLLRARVVPLWCHFISVRLAPIVTTTWHHP
jgi:hypothetical protein